MAKTTKDPKSHTFTISLNDAQFEAVVAEAEAREVSQSQIMRDLINAWRRRETVKAAADA